MSSRATPPAFPHAHKHPADCGRAGARGLPRGMTMSSSLPTHVQCWCANSRRACAAPSIRRCSDSEPKVAVTVPSRDGDHPAPYFLFSLRARSCICFGSTHFCVRVRGRWVARVRHLCGAVVSQHSLARSAGRHTTRVVLAVSLTHITCDEAPGAWRDALCRPHSGGRSLGPRPRHHPL